ncbi:MAG: transposase [Bacteroidales bacterium]|nr:transposase [Bacteroidales bacterium]
MPAEKFRNLYRIGSKRASWHDYNGGEYFVTICTNERQHYFGEIINGEMQLSMIGKYIDECIQKISEHNQYAQIPEYVIMPDHIHLIVIISGNDCRNVPWRVSTENKNESMQKIANHQGRLSTTIGGLKQSVTRFARKNDMTFEWQPRFYDRIIRDQNEMNQIAEYIENNVARWESDNDSSQSKINLKS